MLIRNEIKEARTLYTRELANATSTQNDIYLEIQTAYYNLLEKKNMIPVATLTVKQAKENYELSFGRYKSGVGNPVELKEAQLQYKDAQLNYYNTLYQYNTARANLEKAIGRNIVEDQITINLEPKKIKNDRTQFKKEEKQNINKDLNSQTNEPVLKEKQTKKNKERKSYFKLLKEIGA